MAYSSYPCVCQRLSLTLPSNKHPNSTVAVRNWACAHTHTVYIPTGTHTIYTPVYTHAMSHERTVTLRAHTRVKSACTQSHMRKQKYVYKQNVKYCTHQDAAVMCLHAHMDTCTYTHTISLSHTHAHTHTHSPHKNCHCNLEDSDTSLQLWPWHLYWRTHWPPPDLQRVV